MLIMLNLITGDYKSHSASGLLGLFSCEEGLFLVRVVCLQGVLNLALLLHDDSNISFYSIVKTLSPGRFLHKAFRKKPF